MQKQPQTITTLFLGYQANLATCHTSLERQLSRVITGKEIRALAIKKGILTSRESAIVAQF
jgi:hypothetical protein